MYTAGADGNVCMYDTTREYQPVKMKGYKSTASSTTLVKLMAQQMFRAGDGMYATPESRRAERLFGGKGTGRSKLVKIEFEDGVKYDPEADTCLAAFIRLLAAKAEAMPKPAGST